MELLGENALKSIANLCGVDLNQQTREANGNEEDHEAIEEPEVKKEGNITVDKTNYIIRRGNESDVLKDIRRKDNIVKEINNSSISDYTYEDFVAEFETDVTGEDMFDEDIRIEAEHELLDGGTFTAGRVPDRQYLVVKIKLPREDMKTIDIDAKSDKVLLYSHKYKCRVYWSQAVKTTEVTSTWDSSKHILSIQAPVLSKSADLNF